MPLRLPQLSIAIVCEGNELEMFDVKQEGPSLVRAFVASEAGKVGVSPSLLMMSDERIYATRNSGSPSRTAWTTATSRSICVSTESSFIRHTCEPTRAAVY